MCCLRLCSRGELPWILSTSLITDNVPLSTASRLDSRWCTSLMTAAITADIIRSNHSALSVYSGHTKEHSRGLSLSLKSAVFRVEVAHSYNIKEAGVRGHIKSPSFNDLPLSRSGNEASARPQGRSKYGCRGAIHPPFLHDHVHTIYYSPRRPTPRHSRCSMADAICEAAEPRRPQRPQHRTLPCNLGMRISLFVNECQTLNNTIRLACGRSQSSPSGLYFSLAVWSCCGGKCGDSWKGKRPRVGTGSRPLQMPLPPVKLANSQQQTSRVLRPPRPQPRPRPRPRPPEDSGDPVEPLVKSQPNLFRHT